MFSIELYIYRSHSDTYLVYSFDTLYGDCQVTFVGRLALPSNNLSSIYSE